MFEVAPADEPIVRVLALEEERLADLQCLERPIAGNPEVDLLAPAYVEEIRPLPVGDADVSPHSAILPSEGVGCRGEASDVGNGPDAGHRSAVTESLLGSLPGNGNGHQAERPTPTSLPKRVATTLRD